MASRAALPPPVNETEHSVSRITREGKKITYKLNIMQQPERARACGAGAKSSADRRPVDPPPVVELRIFESDPNDDSHKTDITFAYNANFFLFATLDTARPMAQGRMAPAPSCPVLTGVPVAGVAYLDRPSQAGYFIFPDLSVRHEGVYRLSFHLYEETKDNKDRTEGTPIVPNTVPSKVSPPQSFLDFRLEVVSVPFTVFSAKKFPGLTTSTSLSRIIAEQGCRVRIRRDVRMRRRGDKRSDDYDYEEERVYNGRQSDRYSTPDTYAANPPERPRSTSISTVDHSFHYGSQRRSSGPEFPQQNSQSYQRPAPPAPVAAPAPSTPAPTPAPAPPSHGPSYQSHLAFGSTQTQYPTPQLSRTPQPTTTSTKTYSPRPSFAHVRKSSTSTEHEPPSTSYPYPHSRLSAERPSYSKTTALPPLRLPNALGMQSGEGHSLGQPGGPRSQTPVTSLPPLKSLSGEFTPSSAQLPSGISSSPSHDLGHGKSLLWETSQTLTKRSHDESFGHDDRPLYNGMRPDNETYPGSSQRRLSLASRYPGLFSSSDQMAYKRANGRMATKISPAMQ